MTTFRSRRQFLVTGAALVSASVLPRWLAANGNKPMRGVFVIMATPYTQASAVDYDDLANEVEWLARCGVHGMVWPQMASEYERLTKEERMRGMEVITKAGRGKKPAVVFGVQGNNTDNMLAYARHAEELAPDAMIAIPPKEARSLEDFRAYYRALGRATKRPIFIQTTGGAKDITLTVELMVELAREFPNVAYVKEEAAPVIDRMKTLMKNRPAIKGVMSGAHGRGMLYEARLGSDGTMPGSAYADVHSQVWDLWQAGRRDQGRDLFAKLMLMINLEQHIPGTRLYVMKKRGVFKTMVSRRERFQGGAEEIAEIDANFEALKPHLRA